MRIPALGLSAAIVFITFFSSCAGAPNNSFTASPGISGNTSNTGTTTTGANNAGSGSGGTSNSGTTSARAVQSVTVSPATISSGTSKSAMVTLDDVAPAGGAQVVLTSSNTAAASVPSSVMVAANQSSATFNIVAGTVSTNTSVTIAAAFNNTVAGTTVSVTAPSLPPPPPPPSGPVTVSVSPISATLLAGASQQFTATVSGTTNQSVNWSSTGGGISQSGLYTAPNVSTVTTFSIFAIAAADPSALKSIAVTVNPTSPPPGSGGGVFSGTGPIADWKAYQYLSTDGRYHQAIVISNAKGNYPVRGQSSSHPDCSVNEDSFNDFWTPIGNGLWWFTNRPNLIYVYWTWYDNPTNQTVLQKTPCIDYSAAPKYN